MLAVVSAAQSKDRWGSTYCGQRFKIEEGEFPIICGRNAGAVRNEGAKFGIAPWDYYYYAENSVRKIRLDETTKSAPTSRLNVRKRHLPRPKRTLRRDIHQTSRAEISSRSQGL